MKNHTWKHLRNFSQVLVGPQGPVGSIWPKNGQWFAEHRLNLSDPLKTQEEAKRWVEDRAGRDPS